MDIAHERTVLVHMNAIKLNQGDIRKVDLPRTR